MAVTAGLFGHFASNMLGGMTAGETQRFFDILSNTLKVMLTTASYVPDIDNHKFKSSITNELPAAGGYVAGGATLANPTLSYNAATNTLTFDADDVVWAASTLSNARYAIIYNNRAAADADRELIGIIDFGANMSSAGVDFRIVWNASGIFKITIAAAA